MLLVTSAVKTLLSISQNGISPITLNKQLGYHINKDIINASSRLSGEYAQLIWTCKETLINI
jgi:hypothetical protein